MNELIIDFWEKHSAVILDMGRRILIAILIFIGGRLVIFLGRRIISKASTSKMKLDETIATILKMVLTYATVIICVIMILDDFGFNTTGLIAILGTAGVAIGFALQGTLTNIAFGIIILFLKPFRNGDFVEFGPNMGQVKKIGLFTTEFETIEGVYISATNGNIWNTPLKNHYRGHRRYVELSVRISSNDSIDTAFKVFHEIIDEEKRFLPHPPPQVVVQSLSENAGANIILRAWVLAKFYVPVHEEQKQKIKDKMEAAGLTISSRQEEKGA
jgi:small conductance mechanosensitive channel